MRKQRQLHVGTFQFNPAEDQRPPNGFGPYFGWSYFAEGLGATEEEAMADCLDKVRASGFLVDRDTEARIRNAYGPMLLDPFLLAEDAGEHSSPPREDWQDVRTPDRASEAGKPDVGGVGLPQVMFVVSLGWNSREEEDQRQAAGHAPPGQWRLRALVTRIRSGVQALLRGIGLSLMVLLACAGEQWPHAGIALGQTTARPATEPDWGDATPEARRDIVEDLGEEGARKYAAEQGWVPIWDGKGRALGFGPDQVYRDTRTGRTIVVEAKGGKSRIGYGYGYSQGTPEWAVNAAERVLSAGDNAPLGQRRAAEAVIQAASGGMLSVQVIRTEHVNGIPSSPKVESVIECSRAAAELAKEVASRYQIPIVSRENGSRLEAPRGALFPPRGSQPRGAGKSIPGITEAARNGSYRGAGGEASVAAKAEGSMMRGMKTAAKVARPVAAAADVGSRVYQASEVENAYRRGEIDTAARNREHIKNVAGGIGGWAGAYAGGEAGAWAGGAIGTAICPGIGTAIGGVIGGGVGAIGGYLVGERVAETVVERAM